MDFVHLHVHSEYSMLDGACRIGQLPLAAAAMGQKAIAITDHGNMFGAVHFYKACKKAGVKPIIGCELYVAPVSITDRNKDEKYHHLVLLCKNETGYKNLSKLVSLGYTQGFYGKPRVDEELLIRYHEGLICLSACLAGKIPSLILAGRNEDAEKEALKYGALFGEGNFYLEVQNHFSDEEDQVKEELIRISKSTGLPLVATNDAHYINKKDGDIQAVLMCIQTGRLLADGRPFGFEKDEYYLKSYEEMKELFADCPEALENTVKIAEQCNFDFDFSKRHLPGFPLEDGKKADQLLKELAEEGLKRLQKENKLCLESHTFEDYKFRMIYELMMIAKMGYSDYFLIVRDFVQYARRNGIPVGPGRGSGAGSLVAYLIGITEIDSVRYDLLFERFLNPERVSMPDFDIDFCYNRRDEVIRYVTEKYGQDHVTQIAAFGTLGARAAVRDVGRVLGISYSETDKVAGLIPHKPDVTIKDAMRSEELKLLYEESLSARQLLDTAMAVEGMPRHITTHAAGVVITEKPVMEYMPLTVSSGAVLTQFDMTTVEQLGLLKFDFLALRYLTVIDDACRSIRKKDPSFLLENQSLLDEESYRMICDGETDGVFQLESPGMKRLLIQMRPRSVEDLMIAIALYRPGPMDAIPDFLNARNSGKTEKYEIEGLSEILDSTSGCIVYQEQVMQIFRKVSGYSYGRADVVRRAMAKKKHEELEAERSNFLAGAERNGISKEKANRLFDRMASFASYAFNKSHAAAYAVISYRTAFLKAHYPAEYMAALLTSVCTDSKKTALYISSLEKRRIPVLPPDVQYSDSYFTPSPDGVRYGLLGIKNIGVGLVSAISEERKNGKFRSALEFVSRMSDKGLNKGQLLSLVGAGALDSFSVYRSRLYEGAEDMLKYVSAEKAAASGEQINLFSAVGEEESRTKHTFSFPEIEEYSLHEKLKMEKELTGLWFSGHPLHQYSMNIQEMHALTVADILFAFNDEGVAVRELKNGDSVKVCGMISAVSVKTSKAGNRFAVIKIEDVGAEMECLVFEKVFLKISDYLIKDLAVYLEGKISVKEEESPKITVFNALPLLSDEEFIKIKGRVAVPANGAGSSTEKADMLQSSEKAESATEGDGRSRPSKASAEGAGQTSGASTSGVARVHKLYIRLTKEENRDKRLRALVSIFGGNVPVVYFDPETRIYSDSGKRISVTPYLLSVMKEIAGEENIVFK